MNAAVADRECSPAQTSRLRLFSDLFHALSQPITTLRCSLELSLHRPHTAEQYRETLQLAAEQIEQVARWSSGIGELLQADDCGDNCQILALDDCLRQAVNDLQPLAVAQGKTLLLHCDSPCGVFFEPRRLRGVLLRLLDIALDSSAAGAVVTVAAEKRSGQAIITLPVFFLDISSTAAANTHLGAEETEQTRALCQRLSLAIATATFQSSGGNCTPEYACGHWRIECRLPLAAPGT